MPKHRRRVLTIGAQRYLWSNYHRHRDGCQEVLRLRQVGSTVGLSLVFGPGDGRWVADGGMSAAGDICLDDRLVNLNQPRVVRAFVDAAVAAGWLAEARAVGCRDGWAIFDDAHADLSRPRNCPPNR
ncbi:hypothetical protein ACLMAJ_19745 [Nocardia sp. KC 131]|uniref:hypothetical protein n=1 Tax=Nocardia arseniciresistens TaxID=3392119 RepID=UPI00398E804F